MKKVFLRLKQIHIHPPVLLFFKRLHSYQLAVSNLILFFILFNHIYCHNVKIVKSEDTAEINKILDMYAQYKTESFITASDITVEEFLILKEKSILVDVRDSKERRISIIPNALSKEEFENKKNEFKEYHIIPYCTIGYRSGIFTKKLQTENFNAHNLIGGILLWAHANQRFVDSNGLTNRVHVYGKEWDLLPENYEGVWKK